MIRSVAYVSMHTSPLDQPGNGNAGGMNVYIDRLSRTMVDRGVDVTVFTRKVDPEAREVVEVVPGYRVVQIGSGPAERLPVASLKQFAADFAENVLMWTGQNRTTFDLVHSHYWLSGRTGVRMKDRLGIPLANSFHTLGRVKDAAKPKNERTEDAQRLLTEEEVIAGSDCVIASTPFEFEDLLEHYGASPERLCVSPPGVDHDVFSPGSKADARQRLGFGDERIILFAGRIQPHKGTNTAVDALSRLPEHHASTRLHIVGGASGADGDQEVARCRETIRTHAMESKVEWFEPVRHPTLADHYRSADVVVVPSRSESFGLVAAEAQACGTPVIATNTGGLPYVVNPSESGLLVDNHDPDSWAAAIGAVLDHESFAVRLSEGAVAFSERFSWQATATRMLELYTGITS
ncbi:MAG: glycosyltransferase [Acidimicrobiia bacterium]